MQATSPASATGLPVPRILAVQGASNAEIRAFLSKLVIIWRAAGLRLAGVLEHAVRFPASSQSARVLTDLSTGSNYRVTQELGAGSSSCRIDSASFAAACAGVENAVRRGCDLAIISKFGKLEMERGGLAGAFQAAIAAGIPIVTSVPDYAREAWAEFAEPLTAFVAPDNEAIETWRCAITRQIANDILSVSREARG